MNYLEDILARCVKNAFLNAYLEKKNNGAAGRFCRQGSAKPRVQTEEGLIQIEAGTESRALYGKIRDFLLFLK